MLCTVKRIDGGQAHHQQESDLSRGGERNGYDDQTAVGVTKQNPIRTEKWLYAPVAVETADARGDTHHQRRLCWVGVG